MGQTAAWPSLLRGGRAHGLHPDLAELERRLGMMDRGKIAVAAVEAPDYPRAEKDAILKGIPGSS